MEHAPRPLYQPLQQTITSIYHSSGTFTLNTRKLLNTRISQLVCVLSDCIIEERLLIRRPTFQARRNMAVIFSPFFAILTVCRTAEATYSAEEQRVWYGHTGGSPSCSCPIFTRVKRDTKIPEKNTGEPLDSGNDVVRLLCHLTSRRDSVCFA